MNAVHAQPSEGATAFDRPRLLAVVEPIARAHGAEVVDVELKTEGGGWVLRIFVEKLGAAEQQLSSEQAGVTLELCSNIARELSPALDVLDLISHAYNLEVSSPGVERVLRGEQDFVRFAGKKAKIKLREPARGQKVLVGVLGGVDNGHLLLTDGGAKYEVPLSNIIAARLVFEFGARQADARNHRAMNKKRKRK